MNSPAYGLGGSTLAGRLGEGGGLTTSTQQAAAMIMRNDNNHNRNAPYLGGIGPMIGGMQQQPIHNHKKTFSSSHSSKSHNLPPAHPKKGLATT
jgi:hypothetical protein